MYFSGMDLGMAIGSTGLGALAAITGYHFIYGFSILFLSMFLLIYFLINIRIKQQTKVFIEAT